MTLTQTAIITRRGIIIIIILMILTISGAVGYNIWYQYQLSTIPKFEEKPEMKFGILPKINFPPSKVTSSNYSYSLDTTTGSLPQTPKFLKVYFIPKSSITLMAPEKSIRLAQNLGFPNDPEILSTNVYKFTNDIGGAMIIDLTTGNFSFEQSNVERIATNSAQANLPNQDKIIADFKNYLKDNNLLVEDLKNEKSLVQYNNGTAQNSITAKVSLFPINFDNLPIITPLFNQGLIKAEISGPEINQYPNLNYTFWVIDKTTSSTYPLKTADQVFAELKSGTGFVSIESKSPKVSIASVYLAYLETEEYTPYLQPVFVFEGPDFVGLVPAISTTSTQN
ncbi:MAG: hypothetical protein Q7R43_05405 [Candidatus Daviesbacteria bacterium]|nr:hypothetical protein [Candidatus Daviesbacteria bacterium]